MTCVPGLLTAIVLQAAPSDGDALDFWKDYYAKTAAEYEISLKDRDGPRLEFRRQSVLNFSNAERARGQHGSVFVWTYKGRPEAVGTIWSIRNRRDPTKRRTALELQSLSLLPLYSHRPETPALNGRSVPQWRTTEAGIELKEIPKGGNPAASAAGRLAQMRRLARGFDGRLVGDDGTATSLRLLAQPLLRYDCAAEGVTDGGLFAFVLGTDPELFLLIELREVEGTPQWQYAAARFTGKQLQLRRGDELVWTCGKGETWKGDQPYLFCVGVEELDAAPAEADE